jgi:hypothetical protein
MTRPLRIEFPGAVYPVMNRGNMGMDIYRTKRDRGKFLEYVGEAVKRYGIKVHIYCLMTTQYHFLIENPSDDVVGGVVLGRVDFVNWVKKTFLSKETNDKDIPQLKILKFRPTTDALIQAVSGEFDCGMESILQIGKKRNLARHAAIYLCREMTGETSVALGRRFDISGAGIAAQHDQIAKKLETDRKLKGREHRIRRKIFNI